VETALFLLLQQLCLSILGPDRVFAAYSVPYYIKHLPFTFFPFIVLYRCDTIPCLPATSLSTSKRLSSLDNPQTHDFYYNNLIIATTHSIVLDIKLILCIFDLGSLSSTGLHVIEIDIVEDSSAVSSPAKSLLTFMYPGDHITSSSCCV
jgi:hypothetical protein